MADEEKNVEQAEAQQPVDQTIDAPQAEEAAAQQPEAPAEAAKPSELDQAKADLAQEHDNYLRLAAEYDNFRKRSQKEKDNLYTEIKAETVEKFLPVYDNLERALAQQTADEAFKKGVEMTMTQLTGIFEKLGVTAFGEAGEAFDPTLHNAVMHAEDESAGENVILEVFQKGFRIGEKVVDHHARKYGHSKFGVERMVKGYLDLISVLFMSHFGRSPMYFFGSLGTLMFLLGGGTTVWIIAEKLWKQFHDLPLRAVTDQPLFYLAILAVILGVQLFLAGFLGELINRNSSERNKYLIDKTL